MVLKTLAKFTVSFIFIVLTVLPVQAKNDPHKQYGIKGANLTHTTPVSSPTSYTVNGKTYTTHSHSTSKNYSKTGTASYYHRKFHGRRTSSGEPYSSHLYTAAHKTLPLNSYALVTNLHNNRKTIVRINDRGPFGHGRIIDLSYAAAQEIGLVARGTGQVKIEALHIAPNGNISGAATQTLAKHAKTQAASDRLVNVEKKTNESDKAKDLYKLKMLNLPSQKLANDVITRLALENVNTEVSRYNGKYEIHFGPVENKQTITQLKLQLQKMANGNPLIVYAYKN
jgi:rlpA-like protein